MYYCDTIRLQFYVNVIGVSGWKINMNKEMLGNISIKYLYKKLSLYDRRVSIIIHTDRKKPVSKNKLSSYIWKQGWYIRIFLFLFWVVKHGWCHYCVLLYMLICKRRPKISSFIFLNLYWIQLFFFLMLLACLEWIIYL